MLNPTPTTQILTINPRYIWESKVFNATLAIITVAFIRKGHDILDIINQKVDYPVDRLSSSALTQVAKASSSAIMLIIIYSSLKLGIMVCWL